MVSAAVTSNLIEHLLVSLSAMRRKEI